MSLAANGKQKTSAYKSKQNVEIFRTEPAPLEKINWLIHLQHVRGEIVSCKDLIKSELSKCGERNEYLFFKQGVILRDEGKIQEALEAFQKSLKLNPESSKNVKEVAKCLYLLRRNRLALEAYLEAERISNKSDWEIYHRIGECLIRLGDISKAKEYVTRAVQIGKQESSYDLLMKILITEKDYKSAIAVCNAAIENCPDSVTLMTESGLLHLKNGQMQHAFERLSSALALEPQNPKALLGVGCITQTHEEYDVALSKYKLALQNEPDCTALWNNIGMCFYSKLEYVAAVGCLKRALWLSPLNWKVLHNLGLVHLSTFQPASAFNFLCASVNLRPDVGTSFMNLGYTLLELNDAENALRAFRQAIQLAPNDPVVIINTAICLFKCHRDDEVAELLQRFKVIAENDTTQIAKEAVDLHSRLEELISVTNNTKDELGKETVAVDGKGRDKSTVNANNCVIKDWSDARVHEIAENRNDNSSPRSLASDEV